MNQPKKIIKTEIKYSVSLNAEQKLAKAGVYDKDVSIILGTWGSGKTLLAVVTALDLYFKGYVKKIYITRPINFDATGFIKGSLDEKMAMHVFPMKQNMYTACGKEKIDKLFTEGVIQIVPIDYMKGMTTADAVMIVDEFEDIDFKDFRLILTRLGKDSKLIFTGSFEQVDIKNTCLKDVMLLKDCPEVNYHTFTANHRNDVIPTILEFIDNAKS